MQMCDPQGIQGGRETLSILQTLVKWFLRQSSHTVPAVIKSIQCVDCGGGTCDPDSVCLASSWAFDTHPFFSPLQPRTITLVELLCQAHDKAFSGKLLSPLFLTFVKLCPVRINIDLKKSIIPVIHGKQMNPRQYNIASLIVRTYKIKKQ